MKIGSLLVILEKSNLGLIWSSYRMRFLSFPLGQLFSPKNCECGHGTCKSFFVGFPVGQFSWPGVWLIPWLSRDLDDVDEMAELRPYSEIIGNGRILNFFWQTCSSSKNEAYQKFWGVNPLSIVYLSKSAFDDQMLIISQWDNLSGSSSFRFCFRVEEEKLIEIARKKLNIFSGKKASCWRFWAKKSTLSRKSRNGFAKKKICL